MSNLLRRIRHCRVHRLLKQSSLAEPLIEPALASDELNHTVDLRPVINLVGKAAGLRELLDTAADQQYDFVLDQDEEGSVIVLDSSDLTTEAIQKNCSNSTVVIYDSSCSSSVVLVTQALAAGADAYLTQASPELLVAQLRSLERCGLIS